VSTTAAKNLLPRRANHQHILIIATTEPAPGTGNPSNFLLPVGDAPPWTVPRILPERFQKQFAPSGKSPVYLHHRGIPAQPWFVARQRQAWIGISHESASAKCRLHDIA
jgi:hypothetical protein